MACTNNNTTKPDVTQRPNNLYGAPQGQSGREFNSVDYGIQGIVLHCTDMTISQYVQYLACLTQPVPGVKVETNHHYSIGSAGALNQHIDDNNISWTFGAYQAATYPNPPLPAISVNWPALQTINGQEVSPDVYVINILIAKSYNQGTTCLSATGLPSDQHEKLIQLLAYLSATYGIPLDADHINWHDNIATQACPSNECNCTDISCLLTDINSFCEEDCNTVTYSEVACADVSHLLAIPGNCGNASGCLVSVPFDACCLGHLPQLGDIEQFVGCAVNPTTGDTCLVKNAIQVTAPITGEGTALSPLGLDLCAFGAWVPMFAEGPATAVTTYLGIGDDGCLYQSALTELIPGMETPIAVIDTATVNLTSSGANGHTLQADVNISTATGNILTSDASGLFVSLTCESLTDLFVQSTGIVNFLGVDVSGNCVLQDFETAVDTALCNTPIDDGTGEPMHVLGRDINLDCPIFYTPSQVILAGLGVGDTTTVDLTMAPVGSLNVLSATVNINPADDNVIQITQDGLYVAPIQAQAGDTCLDVQVVDGIITISNIIDPKAENILQCGPDGLCVLDLIAVDTDCFDMTYNSVTREISGAITLSPDQSGVSNVAQCIAGQGFYVPRGANLLANTPLVGDGSETSPLDINFAAMDNEDLCDLGGVIPETLFLVDVIGLDANGCLRQYTGEEFIAQFLAVDNSDCIRTTLTDNSLSIEPIISPPIGAVNNVLSCTPTGLYVPQGGGILPQATNCIALQLVNGILTATPILDPDTLNQLSCNVDGLYVERGAGAVGTTTNCIQVVAANGEISATPIISGAIFGTANILSCEAGGLFVPMGAGLTPVQTNCLTVAFDTATGELSVEPIISPLADNIIQCTANGLYVPAGADDFIQSVDNTDCITLDVTGNTLTATPIIDPDLENLLECRATGLFAQLNSADSNCMTIDITNGSISIEPIIDPAITNLLQCGANGLLVELDSDVFADSDCINFDVVNDLVTATPILAPDQGSITNILRCITGEGLYVPVGGGITTLDGSCIELEIVAGVLTADVIIDQVTADNAITCGPNGLYVPICCPQVIDTNTINLTLNDPRTISADVIIDPDANNVLVSNPNGLFVPTPFVTDISDTQCIALNATSGVLTATPIIDPTGDNQLTCGVNGLYVPPAGGITTADTDCINMDITGTEITATPIISGAIGGINNALQCTPTGLYVPVDYISNVVTHNCIDIQVVDGALIVAPIISGLVDNLLSCEADGLYVQPLTAVSSNCIDVDITGTTLTVNPIISATADNVLQCLADGFYVPDCCPQVVDTNSVDLTLINPTTIQADVIIDPDATNVLVVNPNGLFVPTPFITSFVDSNCIDIDVTDGILTINPIISALPDNAIQCVGDGLYIPNCCPLVTDTNSVDLTLTGTRTISADVVIDPLPDNALTLNAAGLYVPPNFIDTVLDSQCITLGVTGGVLTAVPILDPALDNQLTCGVNGLYVPEGQVITVADTNCIDLDLTADVLTATPIISGNIDNILTCEADGLYVPDYFINQISDTNCIDLDVTGGLLTVNPILSGIADNQLQCVADGLYVPQGQVITVGDTNCIDLDLTANVITANPIISGNADNVLTCEADGLYVPEPFLTNLADTNCISLSETGGVLTANPIISAQAENAVQCLADGFFVQECCPIVVDTPSVDLTLTGLRTISADVIIDPLADNVLVINPDGLYVPPPLITTISDNQCLDLDVTGGVLTITPIIDPAADNILTCGPAGFYAPEMTVVDGNCIDLDINNNTITAEIIISAQAENAAQCLGDGLFIQECCPIVTDTPTVNLTLTGIRTISADVIVDPDVDNQLVVNPNGLYVAPGFITDVADHQCLDLDVTNGILTITPIIDPDVDNALTCGPTGLFVPSCCPQVVDTTTVDLTLIGDDTIQADVIISGDVGNILIDQNGLFVPADFITATNNTNCIDLDVTGGVLTANPVISVQPNNLIQCLDDGLFVEAPVIDVLDTDCINLELNNGIIEASPIIAPTQGGVPNVLECIPGQGMYVPQVAGLQVLDTDCVDLDLTANVLSATITLDPLTDNQLVCNGAGLYVPIGAGIIPIDTNCIDITFDTVTGVFSIEPIIAPTQLRDNLLECLGNGLFVPETVFTRNIGATPVGGNNIDVDTNGDGAADFTYCEGFDTLVTTNDCIDGGIGADYMLREFTLVDKTLTIHSAPEHTAVESHARQAGVLGPGITGLEAPGTLVEQGRMQNQITNPSLCRDMVVTVIATGVMNFDWPTGHNGMSFSHRLSLDSSISGADVSRIGPSIIATSLPAGFTFPDFPVTTNGQSATISWSEVIGPGATVTYDVISNLSVRVNDANVPINNEQIAVVFEFNITGVTV